MPRRLDLSDKAVELMAYLSMHSHQATEQDIARALWPRESPQRASELLAERASEVNRVVARATGNLTPVLAVPGVDLPSDAGPAPRVLVRLLGEPYVEVYDEDEVPP